MTRLARMLEPEVPLKAARNNGGDSCCGSVLRHFAVSIDGRLSFYRSSNEAQSETIALAVAAKRKTIDDVSYCLIDEDAVRALDIESSDDHGTTGVGEVDQLHIDLIDLSITQTAKLAALCARAAEECWRSGKEISYQLAFEVESGSIPREVPSAGIMKILEDIWQSRKYKRWKTSAKSLLKTEVRSVRD